MRYQLPTLKLITDFNISSERSLFTDSSADVSTVSLTQLDDRETISLVSVNEDATFLVHVVNKSQFTSR